MLDIRVAVHKPHPFEKIIDSLGRLVTYKGRANARSCGLKKLTVGGIRTPESGDVLLPAESAELAEYDNHLTSVVCRAERSIPCRWHWYDKEQWHLKF